MLALGAPGLDRNVPQAMRWLERPVLLGSPYAKYFLTWLSTCGDESLRDYERAMKLCLEAAEVASSLVAVWSEEAMM